MLSDSSALLPVASYERDPTVDHQIHRAVLHTMATCHSLHAVNEELLGDPLDIKMFRFTGWSFEELAQNMNVDEYDLHNCPTSVSRPPAGLDYDVDGSDNTMAVCVSYNTGTIKSLISL